MKVRFVFVLRCSVQRANGKPNIFSARATLASYGTVEPCRRLTRFERNDELCPVSAGRLVECDIQTFIVPFFRFRELLLYSLLDLRLVDSLQPTEHVQESVGKNISTIYSSWLSRGPHVVFLSIQFLSDTTHLDGLVTVRRPNRLRP